MSQTLVRGLQPRACGRLGSCFIECVLGKADPCQFRPSSADIPDFLPSSLPRGESVQGWHLGSPGDWRGCSLWVEQAGSLLWEMIKVQDLCLGQDPHSTEDSALPTTQTLEVGVWVLLGHDPSLGQT